MGLLQQHLDGKRVLLLHGLPQLLNRRARQARILRQANEIIHLPYIHLERIDPDLPKGRNRQRNHLCVSLGSFHAHQFHTHLREFPEAGRMILSGEMEGWPPIA